MGAGYQLSKPLIKLKGLLFLLLLKLFFHHIFDFSHFMALYI